MSASKTINPRRGSILAAISILLGLSLLLAIGCARGIQLGDREVSRDAVSLDLRGTNTTDLSPLFGMDSLKNLDIRDNPLTAADYDALALALPQCNIRWSVPIAGVYADSFSEELTLPGFTAADVSVLGYFPELKRVDATGSAAYMALRLAAGQYTGCDFYWTVAIGNLSVPCDAKELDLSGQTLEIGALTEALNGLPQLTRIDTRNTGLEGAAIFSLFETRPEVQIYADVTIAGKSYDSASTELDFSGETTMEPNVLMTVLGYFSVLERVDLGICTMSAADRERLMETFPGVSFVWVAELLPGLMVSSAETELIVKGYDAPDEDLLIENLANLPALKKLDLCACYASSNKTNERMEKLMAAYPEVKFVWLVRVGNWELRTDIIAFSMGNQKKFEGGRFLGGGTYSISNEQLQPVKYCTDLIALDIGHAKHITDVSCIAGLTKVRYLILGMTSITSLEALAGMTELEFLECYQCWITDLSPLLNCKQLKYLNCSTTFVETIDDIVQMTQLKRLWMRQMQALKAADIRAIKAALPNTIICSQWGEHSTVGGWRTKNPAYLHMQRDLFKLVLQDQHVKHVGDPEYWSWDLEEFEAR